MLIPIFFPQCPLKPTGVQPARSPGIVGALALSITKSKLLGKRISALVKFQMKNDPLML